MPPKATESGTYSLVPDRAPPTPPEVEAVLRDPATLWDAVQQASGEYIAVVDRHGIIRACNRIDEGFTADQIIGHNLVRFTVPESSAALDETLRQVFGDGVIRSLETTVRQLDGGFSYYSLRLAPLRHEGRIVAAIVCCENIRPLKDSERALTHERNVLRQLLGIQERERKLISYEIHDGLAQYLNGAMMHFEAYTHARGPTAAPRDFEEGMRLLRIAAVESRRLIGGLRPPALDELGLVDAIDSLVAEAREDVPQVRFTHALAEERLPPQVETIVFRIVQEALTNVRRHSMARKVDVRLEQTADAVLVRIRDDGRGFDPATVPDDRFGLEGIRQRCRLLGGEPAITSSPGAGTTIEARLPLTGA